LQLSTTPLETIHVGRKDTKYTWGFFHIENELNVKQNIAIKVTKRTKKIFLKIFLVSTKYEIYQFVWKQTIFMKEEVKNEKLIMPVSFGSIWRPIIVAIVNDLLSKSCI
jgi:hypothetical protein